MIRNKKISWAFLLLFLLFLLFFFALLGLGVGEVWISPFEALKLIFGNRSDGSIEELIILELRLPRVLLAIAVGGGLSLSGVLLQGIFRNPLVEPYTMGVSGGASLGVTVVIVFGLQLLWGVWMLPIAGFAGALIMILLVFWLGNKKRVLDMNHMLLIGVMISFISSSIMMFLLAITSADNLQGIIFWIMGSLDESEHFLVNASLILSFTVLLFSFLLVKPLNALRLGEEKAKTLGVNTDNIIRVVFVLASLLAGFCVSVVGIIGFVGLIIPHIVRIISGSDFRVLLPASYLLGASFLIISDILARTIISPNELPVGVITGIFGGLLFIFMMKNKKALT